MSGTGRDAAVEQRLALGLKNLWYPVVPGWRLGGDPLGITRLGEKIALWRGAEGEVHAVEDRCPHRGARLSLGWNLGDRVACSYHGVEVDGEGRVRDVPAVESCPLVGERPIRHYPAREIAGAVWLWFGDARNAAPAALDLPEQLADDAEWGHMLCTAFWRCNWRYAVDNVMDPMHGAYLHAVSHSMAEGAKQAKMRSRKTPHGFVFEKVNQRGLNFDWTEFGSTGANWLRLAIPYRRSAGPGGPFWIIGVATPIDAATCQVYFWRCRRVTGWQRDAWRFLYRNRLEGLHWHVLEQDRVVLESLEPDAREREYLYQHDSGLARVRRLLEAEAKKQVAALREQHVAAE